MVVASLTDIVPITDTVDVHGTAVEVRPISARSIGVLLTRFPQIRNLMSGGKITADEIIAIVPEAVEAIIAASCANPGETQLAAMEAAASVLSLDTQLEFLEKILMMTFPGGVGPFVERMKKLEGFAASQFGTDEPTQDKS